MLVLSPSQFQRQKCLRGPKPVAPNQLTGPTIGATIRSLPRAGWARSDSYVYAPNCMSQITNAGKMAPWVGRRSTQRVAAELTPVRVGEPTSETADRPLRSIVAATRRRFAPKFSTPEDRAAAKEAALKSATHRGLNIDIHLCPLKLRA
jgi:hypothetical protein